ncbi:hypothetical protein Tco_0241926 [Tanacetum coccineum]
MLERLLSDLLYSDSGHSILILGTFYFFLGFLTSARTWFELRFKVEKSFEDEMKVSVALTEEVMDGTCKVLDDGDVDGSRSCLMKVGGESGGA